MVLGIYFLTYSPLDLPKLDATTLDPRPKRFDSADEVELAVEGKGVDARASRSSSASAASST